MTQIVPVQPGFSSVVASGPEYGVKYVLTGMQSDGVRITFNDPQDVDNVGFLSNITGLDSPDLRESADDLIGDDGGVHGNFFHGRRPIVLEGMIDNRPNPAVHSELLPTSVINNLVADPSAEPNTSGWGNDGGTITWSQDTATGWPVAGTSSFKVTRTAAGAGNINCYRTTPWSGVAYYPVEANKTYITSCYVRTAATSRVCQMRLQWYDVAGVFISETLGGGFTDTTAPQRIFTSGTAPANATSVRPITDWFSAANAEVHYADAYQLSEGSVLPVYFDGSTSPGPQEPSYTQWTGTAHASTSQLISVTNTLYDENRVRNIRMTALQRVTNAMRKDMQMRWTPTGGTEQVVYLRRQQPLRISGAYNKTFQAALVAADPRIYASAIKEQRFTPGAVTTIRNSGSMRTQPVATIFGPTTGTMNTIEVHNHTTGEFFVFAPTYSLGVGQYIVIDFANKTVTRESGTNIYDQVQYASTTWWQVEPGDNNIEFHASGTTTNANMLLRWQDAWI